MDQSEKDAQFFEEFGGDAAVSDLIDTFYYRILLDKKLRQFYIDVDMTKLRFQQKRFFAQLLGSGQIYQGR